MQVDNLPGAEQEARASMSTSQALKSTREEKVGVSVMERLTTALSPVIFSGMLLGDWLKLLWRVRFAISPRSWPRAITTTGVTTLDTLCRPIESVIYGRRVARTQVQPPLFVLGHWRSGTTYLFNLLSQDDRFAYPNFYQVLFAHTFLFSEAGLSRLLGPLIPKTRGFDNVAMAIDAPQEEEFALAAMTLKSVYMSVAFPQAEEYFDRFLTFKKAEPHQIEQWKKAFLHFAKKLTYKYHKPIIFKSPPHTGRIRMILETFPDARFVHIHRNPYTVFQSNRKLFTGWHSLYAMQPRDFSQLDERIIRHYNEVHDAFFEQRHLIPEGRYYELSYEDLEQNPLEEVRRVYSELNLGDFAHVEERMQAYVKTLGEYKKNKHTELDESLRSRLSREWRRCFDEWNYAA